MKRLSVLCAVMLLVSLHVTAQATEPYVELINEIPCLRQKDTRADLPGEGKAYCAPVAVSNSLMWLGAHGYPRLIPSAADEFAAQASIARTLGSKDYMRADSGASPTDVIRGIERYLQDCGYSRAQLKYVGWRNVPKPYRTGMTTPRLERLQTNLRQYHCVWLNFGKYKYDDKQNTYSREGGHWVTLVGYGQDENGNPDNRVFIVHDPLRRPGNSSYPNSFFTFTKITSGTLTGENFRALPRPAAGYFIPDLPLFSSEFKAILDGAVVLRMTP